MSRPAVYWTSPHSEGWAVKCEGSRLTISVHSTQMEAWYEARRRARGAGGEAVLKNGRGTVRARNTYEAKLLPKR